MACILVFTSCFELQYFSFPIEEFVSIDLLDELISTTILFDF